MNGWDGNMQSKHPGNHVHGIAPISHIPTAVRLILRSPGEESRNPKIISIQRIYDRFIVGIWPRRPIHFNIWLTQEDDDVISAQSFRIPLKAMSIGSFSGLRIKLLWMVVAGETPI
jgi:hypothetical protein